MPWYFAYFFLAIASMRNDVNTKSSLYIYAASNDGLSDGVKQGQGVYIAVITSDNLTGIQTATTEAIRTIKEDDNRIQFNAKMFSLENVNLQNSLVKFCDDVIGENVTAVIMTDVLQQGQFNFVPWISSYLGIPVTLLRNTLGFSTKQVEEYRTVLSMKPAPDQQINVISGIISLYQWTHIAVITSQPSGVFVSELTQRLQQSNKHLQISITETTDHTELRVLLSDIKKSHASVVILDCPVTMVEPVMHSAQDMGLFNGDRAWIVTESITEGSSGISRLPAGLIGIRLRRSCDSAMSTSLHDVLYDSLMVYAHAQKSFIDKGIISPSKRSSCYGDTVNTSISENTSFFRHILETRITGKTGPIQFDRFGNRVNSEYDIMNLQTKSNGKNEWTKIGQWGKNKLAFNKVAIQWLGNKVEPPTNILRTRVLRVATAITEPFAFFGALKGPYIKGDALFCAIGFPCKVYQSSLNGSNNTFERKCCQGFVIDLLGMLENDLGFKADLHVVKDGKYGSIDQGKWNGLIGELIRGEADLAIADLTITDLRSRVVDFTQPFLHSGINILVAVRINRTDWLLRVLEPFTTELWLLSIVTVNIIVFVLWFIDRKSPCGHYRKGQNYKERKQFHLISSLWFSWGTVFHTDECESRPRSYSSRVITVVFGFFVMVLTNSYTANLAAVLVSEGEVLPISGIQDPKLQNPPKGFKVGTVADTSHEKLFKISQDAVYSQIWRNMKANSIKSYAEGVRKIIEGELTGFIGDEPTLLYHISKQESCNLKLTGKSFFQSGFGLALPKNSTLTKRLSTILIQYEQLDVSRKLAKRWLRSSCIKKGPSFTRMRIDDVGGAFGIVVVGVFVSFLFLAFEFYVDRFGFPLSHIWTNKPHRSWPSTRELYRKGLLGNQSEAISLSPLELSLGERRVTPSMRDPWHSLAVYGPRNKTTRRLMLQELNTLPDNVSLQSSHALTNVGFDEDHEKKMEEQDSGRSSLSKNGKHVLTFTQM